MSQISLSLPDTYRVDQAFAFHGRDREQVAESVVDGVLRKAVLIDGAATLFEIRVAGRKADCQAWADNPLPPTASTVETIGKRLLGLTMDTQSFEHAMQRNAVFGPIVNAQRGLVIVQAATPFEALTWAITGQQISLAVAIGLRRRLIGLAGKPHSGGLRCYPDAAGVAALNEDLLGQAKFSRAKARTLLLVSRMVCDGSLPLDQWLAESIPADLLRERLVAIPGVGPWTAHYTMLRGFGLADCSLHGDAAVKNALQLLLGQTEKVSNAQAESWLANFSPWRSLMAAHLWEMKRRLEAV